ncbi:PqqD family protein [Streptomyces sp. NPDC051243]|uniref:PqqD family protein n=1 Tax=Streptomyces sp. NPDC051243 TaxID=3365646 RepID=UPI0037A64294
MSPSEVNELSVPTRNLHVRVRARQDTLHLGLHEQAFELSEVAGMIWRAMDGEADIRSVANRVAAEYEIPEDVALADVLEVVEGLLADSLITLDRPGASL